LSFILIIFGVTIEAGSPSLKKLYRQGISGFFFRDEVVTFFDIPACWFLIVALLASFDYRKRVRAYYLIDFLLLMSMFLAESCWFCFLLVLVLRSILLLYSKPVYSVALVLLMLLQWGLFVIDVVSVENKM